jgi:NAD(P)-dependent dehydrogenase (short-subunit alcohol dehydrogenase family)
MNLWLLLCVGAVPVLLPWVLDAVFSKEFKVHKTGIIVVTGASTGIGRDAAEYLAGKGYHVFAGVRKQSDFDSIEELRVSEKSKNLYPLLLDVTSSESIAAAALTITDVARKTGLPLAALVNNAGIGAGTPVELVSMKTARTVFDVNYFGALETTIAFLPQLRASQGRVVMISSVAGILAAASVSVYSSSKFALEALSDALRREVAGFGVSVSIIEPGYIVSSIVENSVRLEEENAAPQTASLAQLYSKTWSKVKVTNYST